MINMQGYSPCLLFSKQGLRGVNTVHFSDGKPWQTDPFLFMWILNLI